MQMKPHVSKVNKLFLNGNINTKKNVHTSDMILFNKIICIQFLLYVNFFRSMVVPYHK